MPPKSSASSATRKKHARKAAAASGVVEQPPRTREKKGKKHRSDPPRVKMYVAPVKPTAAVRDPLDTMGLAHRLPPELLVVLRSLGKKAAVTKVRALEELQNGWVDKCAEDEAALYTVLDMLPVWAHHLPANLVHPQRRIRLITATIHATLLRFEILRPALTDDASELVNGTWALAAHDVDRFVASVASAARVDAGDPQTLYAFAERTLLHPDALFMELNPPAPRCTTASASSKASNGCSSATAATFPRQSGGMGGGGAGSESASADFGVRATQASSRNHANIATRVSGIASTVGDGDEEGDEETDDYRDPEGLTEGFGFAQPALRRAAWNTLSALLTRKTILPPIVKALSVAVLRSAWVEPDGGVQGAMWGGLLGFLRDHPSSWALAPAAYAEFLDTFLAKACGGAPISAYPSLVVVLSTIPPDILFPVEPFFSAFWAALGGPPGSPASSEVEAAPALTTALSVARARAGAAFVAALLECTVFVVRRSKGEEDGAALFRRELGRVWAALNRRGEETPLLDIDGGRAAASLRRSLESAANVGDELLFAGLDELCGSLRSGGDPALVCTVLAALVGDESPLAVPGSDADTSSPAQRKLAAEARIRQAGQTLLMDLLRTAVSKEDGAFLLRALATFGKRVFADQGFAPSVDELITRRAYSLLLTAPALLFGYLTHRAARREAVYRGLLENIAQHPEAASDALNVLVGPDASVALEGLTAGDPGPLDAFFTTNAIPSTLLGHILRRKTRFLSSAAIDGVLARVVEAFSGRLEAALTQHVPLDAFSADLELLAGVIGEQPESMKETLGHALQPAVYVFGHVLPRAYLPEELQDAAAEEAISAARNLWLQWRDEEAVSSEVLKEIKRRLSVLVCSTDVRVRPDEILATLKEDTLCGPVDIIADIFPAQAELDSMLDALPTSPASPALAVLHPHLSPNASRSSKAANKAYDDHGLSGYARIVSALSQALTDDRRAAKDNVWALRHVLALALYAADTIAAASVPTPVFDITRVSSAELSLLVAKAQQLETYIVTSAADDGWRSRLLAAVTNDKPLVGETPVARLLVELIGAVRREDASRDCRVLAGVLRHVLQDADKAEAELWLGLARKIEKTAPETAITIVSAISSSNLEPPRMERYRNELAADLMGIRASQANSQGLLALRRLAASAPPPDSDVTFLPQQRAVNVFKACQQWIASDEDIDEEVESAMTLVFFSLAPLLQNVPGTHWDLVFDVIENNLENVSLTEDDTLVLLARTLRLVILIQDLARTNKTLRASWDERSIPILTLVRDIAASKLDAANASSPRSTCRELVLSIVQDLPASLISQDTLAQMAHLLADPSADVQKMAYQLLTVAARKRTEHLVIEAGVDAEGLIKADLPAELLDILQMALNFDHGDVLELEELGVFGYLLGWMVVFDLFIDASLKVRSSYIDQLRSLDIIASVFIPNLFSLLGVDQGIPKAFKLDLWAIDEYYIDAYDLGSPWSLQVLAGHLYYRALQIIPSLIHSWVLDCKDRTLSTSIGTYTAHHFSSVLIRAELENVRGALLGLSDEQLSVKVASAVNEVALSYLVDEHKLEIRLRIPADWPLRRIEVKDVQRVGVEEARWRAWILAVQQTLWAQNGRIVDGIGLFKKNVQLHFEGQVECAICYSIISVMDGTLPKKPCKTCKNRFHSGCLYKYEPLVKLPSMSVGHYIEIDVQ
ncbi:Delta-9 fatty acid desaturase protein [Mycena kentingensis (nom. inval.)]|nr:Delta-9 fatty acid desaturase protein [Mycena kentingensis (nom. inval.)]